MASAEHFIQNDPEREEIPPMVRLLPLDLLRRHVCHRSHNLPWNTQSRPIRVSGLPYARGRHPFRQSKVQDFYIAIETNHDVRRFQIPMNDAPCMRRSKRVE